MAPRSYPVKGISLLAAAVLIFAWPQPSQATDWQQGDVVGFDQVDWTQNGTAAALLSNHFDVLYPGGLTVGTGFSISFSSAQAVFVYIPTAGAPGPLDASVGDPETTWSGVFGGDVTALHLDVDFSDAGYLLGSSRIPFGNLVLTNLTGSIANLNGLTIRQLVPVVDVALGGGQTTNTIDDLDNLAAQISAAFGLYPPTAFALNHVVAPPITTRTVTTLNETGPGSIRDIYLQSSSGDTIKFAANLTGTVTLSQGPITINRSLHIVGPGALSLTIAGNGNRVFVVTGGASTITGLTIANGNNTDRANDGSAAQGGAIYISSLGRLTITDCAFNNNVVVGATNSATGGNGGAGQGGAIYNVGILTVDGCTFFGNRATGGAGTSSGVTGNGGTGGAGQGGAIFNDNGLAMKEGSNLSVTNCTFSGNTVTGGATGSGGLPTVGGKADGGAIYNQGTLMIISTTVSANNGIGGAGGKGGRITGATGSSNAGLSSGSGTSTVGNTIIAANTASTSPDVEGPFTSGGHNLIGIVNGSTGFTATGDQTGNTNAPLNPQLGALLNNGGQTSTMAPASNSSAINNGDSTFAPRRDQRGDFRTGTPDIGAFEYSSGIGNVVGISGITRTGTNDATITSEVVIGHTYQLQRATNLTGQSSWSNVDNSFMATGNDFEPVTDLHGITGTRGFYHLVATQ